MTIAFSGLASGLDTTSWITSLTALRQAKITTLETKKEQLTLTQDALTNIRTFFSNFRTSVSKITDAKRGITALDLFSRKITQSSNVNVVTATATAEAEDATYNIKVKQLATNTKATSKVRETHTVTNTFTAVNETYLKDLGITAGAVDVTSGGEFGVQTRINIEAKDTVNSLIDKLAKAGVNATYDKYTGTFSMDIGLEGISDVGNTNITSALNLKGVNFGYESGFMTLVKTNTKYLDADGSTLLSEIGVRAGTINVSTTDADYELTIEDNDTIQDVIEALKTYDINASIRDGVFTIHDARITDDGTTNFITAFGLKNEIAGITQESRDLYYTTILVSSTDVDNSTALSALGVNAGDIVFRTGANTVTVTVTDSESMLSLIQQMKEKGLGAGIQDGHFTVMDAVLINDGTTNFQAAFGLETTINSVEQQSNVLQKIKTITEEFTVDKSTLLSELGVQTGSVTLAKDGTRVDINLISTDTIDSLIKKLSDVGVNANYTDGYFTIDNVDLVNDSTTRLFEIFGFTSNGVGSRQEITNKLVYYETITHPATATAETTLNELAAHAGITINNGNIYVKTTKGSDGSAIGIDYVTVTVGVTKGMTMQHFINALNDARGAACAVLEDGSFAIRDVDIDWGVTGLGSLFGAYGFKDGEDRDVAHVLQETSHLTYLTEEVHAITVNTTHTLGCVYADESRHGGIHDGIIIVGNKDDRYTFAISTTDTFQSLLDKINSIEGASATLIDGVFRMVNVNLLEDHGTNISDWMSLEENPEVTGWKQWTSTLKYQTIELVTTEDQLGEVTNSMNGQGIINGGTIEVFNRNTTVVMTLTSAMTFGELADKFNETFGAGTAWLSADAKFHIQNVHISEDNANFLKTLGLTARIDETKGWAVGNGYRTVETVTTQDTLGSVTNGTMISDGTHSVTAWNLYNTITVTFSKDTTFQNVIDQIKTLGYDSDASLINGMFNIQNVHIDEGVDYDAFMNLLGLTEVIDGYMADAVGKRYTTVETVTTTDTLGQVTNGVSLVEGRTYSITAWTLDNTVTVTFSRATTFGELEAQFDSLGPSNSASLVDGKFSLENIHIDEGGDYDALMGVLGLTETIDGFKCDAIAKQYTTVETVRTDDTLWSVTNGTALVDGQAYSFTAYNLYTTAVISFTCGTDETTGTTFQQLIDQFNALGNGSSASLVNGKFSIENVHIVENESYTAFMNLLGLTEKIDEYKSDAVAKKYTTVETITTSDTLGVISNGTMISAGNHYVTAWNMNNTITVTFSTGHTIQDIIDQFNSLGSGSSAKLVDGHFSMENIHMDEGADYTALINLLGLTEVIDEYKADSVAKKYTTVETVTTSDTLECVSNGTKLGNGSYSVTVWDVGNTITVSFTKNTTFGDLISQFNNGFGRTVATLSEGHFDLENVHIDEGADYNAFMALLGLTETIDGFKGDAVAKDYVTVQTITTSDTLGSISNGEMFSGSQSLTAWNMYTTVTINFDTSTTLGDLISQINALGHGSSASLVDGHFSIENVHLDEGSAYNALMGVLGLTEVIDEYEGDPVPKKYTTVETVTTSDTLGQVSNGVKLAEGRTYSVTAWSVCNTITVTFGTSTTFGELQSQFNALHNGDAFLVAGASLIDGKFSIENIHIDEGADYDALMSLLGLSIRGVDRYTAEAVGTRYSTVETITTNDTLGDVSNGRATIRGTGNHAVTAWSTSTTVTINFSESTTFGNLIQQFNAIAGGTADLTAGKFSLENIHIDEGADYDLLIGLLGLSETIDEYKADSIGIQYTTVETVTTSDTLGSVTNGTMFSGTKSVEARMIDKTITVNFDTNTTFGDLIAQFNTGFGTNVAALNNGRFTLDNVHLVAGDGRDALLGVLGLTETIVEYKADPIAKQYKTVELVTTSDKLGDVSNGEMFTGSHSITAWNFNKTVTINFDTNTTFQQLIDQFNALGSGTASLGADGRFNIQNVHIEEGASCDALLNVLGLTKIIDGYKADGVEKHYKTVELVTTSDTLGSISNAYNGGITDGDIVVCNNSKTVTIGVTTGMTFGELLNAFNNNFGTGTATLSDGMFNLQNVRIISDGANLIGALGLVNTLDETKGTGADKQYTTVQTITTHDTLAALSNPASGGFTNGTLTAHNKNGVTCNINVGDVNTYTFGQLINALNSAFGDGTASLVDGMFTIQNINIDSDGINLVGACGLSNTLDGYKGVGANKQYTTIETITTSDTFASLGFLNDGSGIFIKNKDNVTLDFFYQNKTIGDFIDALNSTFGAGTASLVDGIFTMQNVYIDYDDDSLVDVFGLQKTVDGYKAVGEGKEYATLQEIGSISRICYVANKPQCPNGVVEFKDIEGNSYTVTVDNYHDSFESLINKFNTQRAGTASFSDGVLTLNGIRITSDNAGLLTKWGCTSVCAGYSQQSTDMYHYTTVNIDGTYFSVTDGAEGTPCGQLKFGDLLGWTGENHYFAFKAGSINGVTDNRQTYDTIISSTTTLSEFAFWVADVSQGKSIITISDGLVTATGMQITNDDILVHLFNLVGEVDDNRTASVESDSIYQYGVKVDYTTRFCDIIGYDGFTEATIKLADERYFSSVGFGNAYVTITVSATDNFYDLQSKLQAEGFGLNIGDTIAIGQNPVTYTLPDGSTTDGRCAYVCGGTLLPLLGLSSVGFQTQDVNYEATTTASLSTTLSEVGLSGGTVIFSTHGEYSTITVSSSETFSSLKTKMASKGYVMLMNNGRVSVTLALENAPSSTYISGWGTYYDQDCYVCGGTLAEEMGIVGEQRYETITYTLTTSVTVGINNSDPIPIGPYSVLVDQTIVIVGTTINPSGIGAVGDTLTVVYGSGNTKYTVTATRTYAGMTNAVLASKIYGISGGRCRVSIDEYGIVSVASDYNGIFEVSGNVADDWGIAHSVGYINGLSSATRSEFLGWDSIPDEFRPLGYEYGFETVLVTSSEETVVYRDYVVSNSSDTYNITGTGTTQIPGCTESESDGPLYQMNPIADENTRLYSIIMSATSTTRSIRAADQRVLTIDGETFEFLYTARISDVISKFQSKGYTAYLDSSTGKLIASKDSGLGSVSGGLADVLGIVCTSGGQKTFGYTSYRPAQVAYRDTLDGTDQLKYFQNYDSDQMTIYDSNNNVFARLNGNRTVDDLIAACASVGITATISGMHINFTSNSLAHVEMSVIDASKTQYTYGYTSETLMHYNYYAADDNTKLGDLGVTEGILKGYDASGAEFTINITTDMTMGTLRSQLAAKGLTVQSASGMDDTIYSIDTRGSKARLYYYGTTSNILEAIFGITSTNNNFSNGITEYDYVSGPNLTNNGRTRYDANNNAISAPGEILKEVTYGVGNETNLKFLGLESGGNIVIKDQAGAVIFSTDLDAKTTIEEIRSILSEQGFLLSYVIAGGKTSFTLTSTGNKTASGTIISALIDSYDIDYDFASSSTPASGEGFERHDADLNVISRAGELQKKNTYGVVSDTNLKYLGLETGSSIVIKNQAGTEIFSTNIDAKTTVSQLRGILADQGFALSIVMVAQKTSFTVKSNGDKKLVIDGVLAKLIDNYEEYYDYDSKNNKYNVNGTDADGFAHVEDVYVRRDADLNAIGRAGEIQKHVTRASNDNANMRYLGVTEGDLVGHDPNGYFTINVTHSMKVSSLTSSLASHLFTTTISLVPGIKTIYSISAGGDRCLNSSGTCCSMTWDGSTTTNLLTGGLFTNAREVYDYTSTKNKYNVSGTDSDGFAHVEDVYVRRDSSLGAIGSAGEIQKHVTYAANDNANMHYLGVTDGTIRGQNTSGEFSIAITSVKTMGTLKNDFLDNGFTVSESTADNKTSYSIHTTDNDKRLDGGQITNFAWSSNTSGTNLFNGDTSNAYGYGGLFTNAREVYDYRSTNNHANTGGIFGDERRDAALNVISATGEIQKRTTYSAYATNDIHKTTNNQANMLYLGITGSKLIGQDGSGSQFRINIYDSKTMSELINDIQGHGFTVSHQDNDNKSYYQITSTGSVRCFDGYNCSNVAWGQRTDTNLISNDGSGKLFGFSREVYDFKSTGNKVGDVAANGTGGFVYGEDVYVRRDANLGAISVAGEIQKWVTYSAASTNDMHSDINQANMHYLGVTGSQLSCYRYNHQENISIYGSKTMAELISDLQSKEFSVTQQDIDGQTYYAISAMGDSKCLDGYNCSHINWDSHSDTNLISADGSGKIFSFSRETYDFRATENKWNESEADGTGGFVHGADVYVRRDANLNAIGEKGEIQKWVTYSAASTNDLHSTINQANMHYLGVTTGNLAGQIGRDHNINISIYETKTMAELISELGSYGFNVTQEDKADGCTYYTIQSNPNSPNTPSNDRSLDGDQCAKYDNWGDSTTSNILTGGLFTFARELYDFKSTQNKFGVVAADGTGGFVHGEDVYRRLNGNLVAQGTAGEIQKWVTYSAESTNEIQSSTNLSNMKYLGVTEGKLVGQENGTTFTIDITYSMTVEDLRAALAAHGFTISTSTSGGKTSYVITASGNRSLDGDQCAKHDNWGNSTTTNLLTGGLFTFCREEYDFKSTENSFNVTGAASGDAFTGNGFLHGEDVYVRRDADLNAITTRSGGNGQAKGEIQKWVTYSAASTNDMHSSINQANMHYLGITTGNLAGQIGRDHNISISIYEKKTVAELISDLGSYGFAVTQEDKADGCSYYTLHTTPNDPNNPSAASNDRSLDGDQCAKYDNWGNSTTSNVLIGGLFTNAREVYDFKSTQNKWNINGTASGNANVGNGFLYDADVYTRRGTNLEVLGRQGEIQKWVTYSAASTNDYNKTTTDQSNMHYLGVTDGNLVGWDNGTIFTIAITGSLTVESLRSQLEAHNFHVTETTGADGKSRYVIHAEGDRTLDGAQCSNINWASGGTTSNILTGDASNDGVGGIFTFSREVYDSKSTENTWNETAADGTKGFAHGEDVYVRRDANLNVIGEKGEIQKHVTYSAASTNDLHSTINQANMRYLGITTGNLAGQRDRNHDVNISIFDKKTVAELITELGSYGFNVTQEDKVAANGKSNTYYTLLASGDKSLDGDQCAKYDSWGNSTTSNILIGGLFTNAREVYDFRSTQNKFNETIAGAGTEYAFAHDGDVFVRRDANLNVVGSKGEIQKHIYYDAEDQNWITSGSNQSNMHYLGVTTGNLVGQANGQRFTIAVTQSMTVQEFIDSIHALNSRYESITITVTQTDTVVDGLSQSLYTITGYGNISFDGDQCAKHDNWGNSTTTNILIGNPSNQMGYGGIFTFAREVYDMDSTENHANSTGIHGDMRLNEQLHTISATGEIQKHVDYSGNDKNDINKDTENLSNMLYLHISTGVIWGYEEGSFFSINVNNDTTVADLKAQLASHGFYMDQEDIDGKTYYSIRSTGNRALNTGVNEASTQDDSLLTDYSLSKTEYGIEFWGSRVTTTDIFQNTMFKNYREYYDYDSTENHDMGIDTSISNSNNGVEGRVDDNFNSTYTKGEIQKRTNYSADDDTMLVYLGVDKSGTVYVRNEDGVDVGTITIDHTKDTIGDLKNKLSAYGLTLQTINTSEGTKYVIDTTLDRRLVDGSSDAASALFGSERYYYSITHSTTLADLGVQQNGEFVIEKTDGTWKTITVSTTDTLDSLYNKMKDHGFHLEWTTYLAGGTTAHLWSDAGVRLHECTTDAVDVLFGGDSVIFDYSTRRMRTEVTVTVRYDATEDTVLSNYDTPQVANGTYGIYDYEYGEHTTHCHEHENTTQTLFAEHTTTYTVNGTVYTGCTREHDISVTPTSTLVVNGQNLHLNTLENHEIKAGVLAINDNGNRYLYTITYDTTIGSFINDMIARGFQAGYDEEHMSLWVRGTGDVYIEELERAGATDICSNMFKGYLVRTYNYNGVLDMSTTEEIAKDANVKTNLDQLGINDGNMVIHTNNKDYTVQIKSTDKIEDLRRALSGYNVDVSLERFDNGGSDRGTRLVFTGSGDTYIKSGPVGFPSIASSHVTYNYEANEDTFTHTNIQEETIKADDYALLSDFGITEGQYYIYSNGVKHTARIEAGDTFKKFKDTLQMYGIQSSFVNTASGLKLVLNGVGDTRIVSSSSTTFANSNVADIIASTTDMTYNYSADLDVDDSLTERVVAKNSSLLREFKTSNDEYITSGQFYVYNNGVRRTLNIDEDETFGSLIKKLQDNGLQASLVSSAEGTKLVINGNGNSRVAKSTAANSSNIVDIFSIPDRYTYNYNADVQTSYEETYQVVATSDTLLSDYNTGTYKAEGTLSLNVDGNIYNIKIGSRDTFGTLVDKLNSIGVKAHLDVDEIAGSQLIIESGFSNISIAAGTTSGIVDTIRIQEVEDFGGYAASSAAVTGSITQVVDDILSVANFIDTDTKVSLMNVSAGTLSIYKNGQKATIMIDSDDTFGTVAAKINAAFNDVTLSIEKGRMILKSSEANAIIECGTTTDTSNFYGMVGLVYDGNAMVSSRELYKVNGSSKLTTEGLFRTGNVTAGDFKVGNATFTITNDTTLNDLIAQINASDQANATAYWDSVEGKFTIKSRVSGYSLINIEAGSSNFTDIMKYTDTVRDEDNNITESKLVSMNQDFGNNAIFTINGTQFMSTSNQISSDVSMIRGVTLDLKSISPKEEISVTIAKDEDTLADAVSEVVDAYNELIENVDKELGSDGLLKNDSALKLIRNQIRNLMMGTAAGNSVFRNLDAIGIIAQMAETGNISTKGINTLFFDRDKFIEKYRTDSNALKQLLIGSDTAEGIFANIDNILEQALSDTSGYFDSSIKTYGNQIAQLNKKIARATASAEAYRARLEAKFNSMDILIGDMQDQYATFLENQSNN